MAITVYWFNYLIYKKCSRKQKRTYYYPYVHAYMDKNHKPWQFYHCIHHIHGCDRAKSFITTEIVSADEIMHLSWPSWVLFTGGASCVNTTRWDDFNFQLSTRMYTTTLILIHKHYYCCCGLLLMQHTRMYTYTPILTWTCAYIWNTERHRKIKVQLLKCINCTDWSTVVHNWILQKKI